MCAFAPIFHHDFFFPPRLQQHRHNASLIKGVASKRRHIGRLFLSSVKGFQHFQFLEEDPATTFFAFFAISNILKGM